jgi:hypothetical protein
VKLSNIDLTSSFNRFWYDLSKASLDWERPRVWAIIFKIYPTSFIQNTVILNHSFVQNFDKFIGVLYKNIFKQIRHIESRVLSGGLGKTRPTFHSFFLELFLKWWVCCLEKSVSNLCNPAIFVSEKGFPT